MVLELQGMLRGLLQPDPRQRMTLDELLLQSWVSQHISLAEYSWSEVICSAQSYCKLTNQSVFLNSQSRLVSVLCSFTRLTTVTAIESSSTYQGRAVSRTT